MAQKQKNNAPKQPRDLNQWAKRMLVDKTSGLTQSGNCATHPKSEMCIRDSTNPVENQIRPLTLTRKNALFAGHDEGGRTWARLASFISTCKINGVEPYAWMKTTLEAIAQGHPQARIDELMPWAFDRTP